MAKEEKKKPRYTSQDITVLEGLDPVRKRPGMYIGSTGIDGLHHLIWEVVDNSIDEAMAGYAKFITITLMPHHRVSVVDDGRGIPVDMHKQTKKSALETVLTTLHAGGKFGGESYKVSGGLHGVGVSVVNALSRFLRVEVMRDGDMYSQEYAKGIPKTKVKKEGKASGSGTTVIYEPDPEIFGADDKMPEYAWGTILTRVRQQAYLTAGVTIRAIDARKGEPISHTFHFEGGVKAYIASLTKHFQPVHPNAFYTSKEAEGVQVEVALQYVDDLQTHELSFANNIHTIEGGMHLTGFRTALTRVLNDYARKNDLLKKDEENLTGEDVREGLCAIISVKIRDPQFEGQTKAKLGSVEARSAVDSVFSGAFMEFLEQHPQDARGMIGKVVLAAKARRAAKAAKETILRKGALSGFTLPGKLADCQSKNAEDSEIFIVEGDSAGGSAKQARSREFQAILPLRGKILNVERARLDKILASTEIRALVIAMGAGIGEEFDISKLRYHKIVIMTDADVDGAHIRTLLLTMFYRYYMPIIDQGFLYIAEPPLYRIQKGKRVEYAFMDADKERILAEFKKLKEEKEEKEKSEKEEKKPSVLDAIEAPPQEAEEVSQEMQDPALKGVIIQRYKGLGEMNPIQLWETTMDPATRHLRKVSIDDAKQADIVFDVLMGSEVGPRKHFIQSRAKSVKNLDV